MDGSIIKQRLQHDCSKCASLCCTTLPFFKKDGFAYEKPAGMPCLHLNAQHQCTIHETLAEQGFPGCVSFSCAGAGQRVTQEIYAGQSWQDNFVLLGAMMDTFILMRQVHEVAKRLIELPVETLTPKQADKLAEIWEKFNFEQDWTLESLNAFGQSDFPDEMLEFADSI